MPRAYDAPISEAAQRAHDLAVANGQSGYLDPASGLFVMTASALAARAALPRRAKLLRVPPPAPGPPRTP